MLNYKTDILITKRFECIHDLNMIHSRSQNISISQKSFSDETISKLCDYWIKTLHKGNLDDKPHSEQELFSARHINSVCSYSVAPLNWKF